MSKAIVKLLRKRIEGGIVITAEGRHIIKEGPRYKVYLPIEHNDTWEDLRKLGKTITVIIVIK
jgi:hypothetical protein